MTIGISTALANARLDQTTVARDAGAGAAKLRIYNGTRPATGGAVTTLLAELTFSDPSGPAASSRTLTMNTITGVNAVGTGTATWFREVDSDDNFVQDGSAGTSGADLNLNTVDIVTGNPVNVTSYVITEGNP